MTILPTFDDFSLWNHMGKLEFSIQYKKQSSGKVRGWSLPCQLLQRGIALSEILKFMLIQLYCELVKPKINAFKCSSYKF